MIRAALELGMPLAALPPVVHASYAMYVLTIILLLPPLVFILLAKRGKELYIRRIPGIDAIEEAIGRATELGRPMMFTTGLTRINPLLYALLGILRYIAGKAAAYGCRLIVPQTDYEVLPIVEETTREAYRAAGRIDQFNPRDVRFLSTNQFAFASGYMGIAHREKAASCFLFGSFAAESLILAEAGQQVGAMQVAGTESLTQVPFFLTSCDYTIIGEEVYAAGAYLSREPTQLGSVRGQDVAKLVVLVTVLIGTVWATCLSVAKQDYREGWEYNSEFARAFYKQPEWDRLLAKVEFKDTHKLSPVPEHEDLEYRLALARKKIAKAGRNIERKLAQIGSLAASEEKHLRDRLELFPAGDGRDEARATADILKGISERIGEELDAAKKDNGKKGKEREPASLANLLREVLPGIGKVCREKARERTVGFFTPEQQQLRAWAAKRGAPKAGPAAALDKYLAEVKTIFGNAAATPRQIRARVADSRRVCYRQYYDLVRPQVRATREAADESVPRFLLRTNEGLKKLAGKKNEKPSALLLDGGRSASARGRPLALAYEWEIKPSGSEEKPKKLRGRQAAHRFDKPGRYEVKLTVSELLKPTLSGSQMIIGIDSNDPSLVKYDRMPAGTELAVSWRLPKTFVKDVDMKIEYDFGERGVAGKPLPPEVVTKDTPAAEQVRKHKYDKPGYYCMTITVSGKVRVKSASARSARARAVAAAAEAATPELTKLRGRLGETLTELTDKLGGLNSDLGLLARSTNETAGRLRAVGQGDSENWPDKALAGNLMGRVTSLAAFATKNANLVGPKAGAAETFGSGNSPKKAGAAVPVALRATGDPKKAEKLAPYWKRYRIYWSVLERLTDSTTLTVQIDEAPERLIAPWEMKLPPKAKGGGE